MENEQADDAGLDGLGYNLSRETKFSSQNGVQGKVRFPSSSADHEQELLLVGQQNASKFKMAAAMIVPKRTNQRYTAGTPVLSACPSLHTDSGCGKERRILIGPW